MGNNVYLHQTVGELAYSELSPADFARIDSLKDAVKKENAIKKANAREFYRNELALRQVCGAVDQIEKCVTSQDNLSRVGLLLDGQHDPMLSQIENGMDEEITQVGSKIPNIDVSEVSEQEVINNPILKVSHYTNSMVENGIADQKLLTSLVPSSTGEFSTSVWLNTVARTTTLNMLIEMFWNRWFPPAPTRLTADNEVLRADLLYDHLKRQHCNDALLHLSDWDNTPEGMHVFQLHLSCSSGSCWATCTFERSAAKVLRKNQPMRTDELQSDNSKPDDSQEAHIDISSDVKLACDREVPLRLSFNDRKLWKSKLQSGASLSAKRITRKVDFGPLLTQGIFKTSGLDDTIRKFSFTVRLVSSLCSLYLGPWIQQDWSRLSLQVIPEEGQRLIDILDETYVSCRFTADRRRTHLPLTPPSAVTQTEVCPRFFLSLAQLLVDVVNGEESNLPTAQDDLNGWYRFLANEVRKNGNDRLVGKYWRAIEGCLLYLENYDSHGADPGDERLRAQLVIRNHIVRHLREHLNFWREQQAWKVNNVSNGGADLKRVERSAGKQTLQISARSKIETKFNLWSDLDEGYTTIQTPTEMPDEFSFVSLMKTFRDVYIEKLPEPSGNGSIGQRVRVAILDTGLCIEEEDCNGGLDPILGQPDVKSKIIEQRNFFSRDDSEPNPYDVRDEHGHGTLVARLVLQFAPRAELVIAKISNSKSLKTTKTTQLALLWAGSQADIINLSFSLGSKAIPDIEKAIKYLVNKNKLIFAAASNAGGYGTRPYPAKRFGVFAIHATNERSHVDPNMNLSPQKKKDNFATFGYNVESFWKGDYTRISGTSFATPVAAAICANVLEFARRTQDEEVVKRLTRYGAIRRLFRRRMCPDDSKGSYHCLHPWTPGLWDGDTDIEAIGEVLAEISL